MPHTPINGALLDYDEQGSGETIVFVHGSASDRRTWENQITEFSRTFRVLSYSRRYHWPNEHIPDEHDYSMQEQTEDLKAFLLENTQSAVHLVGHSYGAFLCLLLAIEQPDLIRSLVLAEPPVLPLFVDIPPKTSQLFKLLLRRPRTAFSIINFGAKGIGPATKAVQKNNIDKAIKIFGSAVMTNLYFQRLSKARLEQVEANFIKAEFLGSGFSSIAPQDITRIEKNTLLITGQDSPALFHRLTDRLEELLPRCQRVEIPQASHLMHEDNSQTYNSAVKSFLDKQ